MTYQSKSPWVHVRIVGMLEYLTITKLADPFFPVPFVHCSFYGPFIYILLSASFPLSSISALYCQSPVFFLSVRILLVNLQCGSAEAEIKVPSAENPDLFKFLSFQPGVDQNVDLQDSPTASNLFVLPLHLLYFFLTVLLTCHLYFWQNDQFFFLCATAVTRGWNRH